MHRRSALVAAVALGSVALLPVTASAGPNGELNFGHCVSAGLIDPSSSALGPFNTKANIRAAAAHVSHHFDKGVAACLKL
jgi:hypothetical protein